MDVTATATTVPAPWARRHPAGFVLALYLVFEVVHVAIAWDDSRVVRTALPGLPDVWLGPVIWGLYAAIALVMVGILGWWRSVGLTRRPRRGSLALLLYPLATTAALLGLGFGITPAAAVPLLVVGAPLIALNEEVFFRGIALEGLRPQGWRSAIIGSAALFGVAHSVNIVAGADVPFTIGQILITTTGGITLAAIRIRSGSLWPAIALHLGIDLVALSTLTGPGLTSPLMAPALAVWSILNVSLWWYGWRLLRGRSERELDDLYDGIPSAR